MYEYLEGRLAQRGATRIVLDVCGVGYDLACPLGSDFRPASSERPDELRVWTHLVVREDAHLLFGFPDQRLREIFRLLLKVRGVGPQMALAILSSLPGEELLEAIAAEDGAALTRIKGVGKKTAEQILLDLRDRAPKVSVGTAASTGVLRPQGSPARSQAIEDAIGALISIGYTDKQAQKSVERAAKKVDPPVLEELVRAALQE